MKALRKVSILLLTLCMGLGVFGGFALTQRATAEEAPQKALKFSISKSHSDFSDERYTSASDDTVFIVETTPFPATADVDGAFKGDTFFGETWWKSGIGSELIVDYEYALNMPISGGGSVNALVDQDPWFLGRGGKDADGIDAVDLHEDAALLTNGWRHRTVSFKRDQMVNEKLHGEGMLTLKDVCFFMPMLKSDLENLEPDGTVELYLKSMKVTFGNADFRIYDSTDETCLWNRFPEKTNDFHGKFIDNPGNSFKDCAGLTDLPFVDQLTFGGQWNEVDLPNFVTITQKADAPKSLTVGEEYDLKSFVTTSDASEVTVAVQKDGEDVEVSDATKFTPNEAGEYTITYTAQGTYPSTVTIKLTCAPSTVPVILEEDVDAAVPKTGHAHEVISIGKVMASLAGADPIATTVTVKRDSETGGDVDVTDKDDHWEFRPTEKLDATYFVQFTAENEGNTVTSAWKQIVVTDIDKPVIDFSKMYQGEAIGQRYTLAQITDGLTVTDISDGDITDYTVVVTDPIGAELKAEADGKYFVINSGKHIVTVTATDTDDNTVTASGMFTAVPVNGSIVQVTFNIKPEGKAEGQQKKSRIQIFELDHKDDLLLNAGATLRWEVMGYTVIDGEKVFIPGIGTLTSQVSDNVDWPFIHEAIREDALDNNGVSIKANADLSAKMHDDQGRPVWVQREYKFTAEDADSGLFGKKLYHLATAIDTTAEVGDQIFVFLRNFQLVKPDGTVFTLEGNNGSELTDNWTDEEAEQGGWGKNIASHNVSATLDRFPIYIDGEIETSVGIGQTVRLPKTVMKDAFADDFVEVTYTVKGPDGQNVELTDADDEFTFKAAKNGKYTVTVTGANEHGSTTVTVEITAEDSEEPTITQGTFPEAKKGQAFSGTILVTDDNTAPEDLEIEVDVFRGTTTTKVESSFTFENGTLTVTFTPDQAGAYRIVVTAIDEAENEGVRSFNVAVSEEQTTPGTGGDTPTTPGTGDDNPTTPGTGGDTPTTPGTGDDNPTTPGTGDKEPTTPGTGDDTPTTPGTGDKEPADTAEKKGCGSVIGSVSVGMAIALLSALVVALVLVRKKASK